MKTAGQELLKDKGRIVRANILTNLNQAVDVGLQQLKEGQKVNAMNAYKRLKQKIMKIKG